MSKLITGITGIFSWDFFYDYLRFWRARDMQHQLSVEYKDEEIGNSVVEK